ncbi:MAG: glycogen synthase [Desulfobaccales bacterium]
MKIAILTNEYPPHIYGGAGVHVSYLTRELARLEDRRHTVKVLCFGEQRETLDNETVTGVTTEFTFPFQEPRNRRLLDTLYRNLIMTGSLTDVDLIHCHTWYTHLAGCLLKHLLGVPLVLTTHSLEPHRPWKADQLGPGYQVSTWVEKTAYQNADGVIAVSRAMKTDVQELYGVPPERTRVIYNGIDVSQYQPTFNPEVLHLYHIDPDCPYVLFVGRITYQKGIMHLLKAIEYFQAGVQVVLCASGPDTPEIGQETAARIEALQAQTGKKIVWISTFVPQDHVIPIYSHAALFICPSIYEPFGIINLEAMACGTPVVASAVGGIKEVVLPGETGLLVPLDLKNLEDPKANVAQRFAQDLAAAVNQLLDNPDLRREMGIKARQRVLDEFSWTSIARQTLEFYRELTGTVVSGQWL